jgi:putative hydrolase
MKPWRLFADWHTHTIYSDGKGSIAENAQAALTRGLSELAITDHAPNNLGIGMRDPAETFREMRQQIDAWNKEQPKLQVKLGCEVNLIGQDGQLDLPDELLEQLDLTIVSLHPLVKPDSLQDGLCMFLPDLMQRVTAVRSRRLRNRNTKAMVEAVYKHDVSFVGHPGLWIDIDTRELAEACVQRGTALEINCSHVDALTGYVQAAMPSGVDFVINSDAHLPQDVGRQQAGIDLANCLGLDPARIRNARVGR